MDKDREIRYKSKFVSDLGDLLHQANSQISGASYEEAREVVVVKYVDGSTQEINVNMDSRLAIAYDVVKGVLYGSN